MINKDQKIAVILNEATTFYQASRKNGPENLFSDLSIAGISDVFLILDDCQLIEAQSGTDVFDLSPPSIPIEDYMSAAKKFNINLSLLESGEVADDVGKINKLFECLRNEQYFSFIYIDSKHAGAFEVDERNNAVRVSKRAIFWMPVEVEIEQQIRVNPIKEMVVINDKPVVFLSAYLSTDCSWLVFGVEEILKNLIVKMPENEGERCQGRIDKLYKHYLSAKDEIHKQNDIYLKKIQEIVEDKKLTVHHRETKEFKIAEKINGDAIEKFRSAVREYVDQAKQLNAQIQVHKQSGNEKHLKYR